MVTKIEFDRKDIIEAHLEQLLPQTELDRGRIVVGDSGGIIYRLFEQEDAVSLTTQEIHMTTMPQLEFVQEYAAAIKGYIDTARECSIDLSKEQALPLLQLLVHREEYGRTVIDSFRKSSSELFKYYPKVHDMGLGLLGVNDQEALEGFLHKIERGRPVLDQAYGGLRSLANSWHGKLDLRTDAYRTG